MRSDASAPAPQIDVERYHCVTARRIEAGRERRLLAEIARQQDRAQAPIAPHQLAQLPPRGIRAAVVDEHDVEATVRQPLHHPENALDERAERGPFVVDRDQ